MAESKKRRMCSRAAALGLALVMFAAGINGCGGSGAAGAGSSLQEGAGAAGSNRAETNAADPENSGAATEGKALTLMLYLCGSDLESKAGAASADLEEILASGVNLDKVNIAVMAGGTTKWTNGFSEEETAVYKATGPSGAKGEAGELAGETGSVGSAVSDVVPSGTVASKAVGDKGAEAGTSGAASAEPAAGGESDQAAPPQGWEKMKSFSSPEQAEAPANMGEKDTLKAFLDYSYEEFPAQEYALIMWDHGGGPMRGLCWDTAWAKDNLTMEEFTGALAESPFAAKKLGWIGFDACLMSSVETAHLVSPYADYMIASEETEPSLGWSYSFLKGIEEDESGAQTGPRIVDAFFEAAEKEKVESALTLSCTDLSKVKDVEQKLDGFFGRLSGSLDADSFSELSNMRQDTREFGKAMDDSQRLDLVDLGDLVRHYSEEAPDEAKALSGALEEMVIYNRSSIENCTGLSSYHPYYNKTYYEKAWQKEYGTFNFAPSYTDYINNFARIWMGEAMGDWSQMSRVQAAGISQDIQYFSVQLTPEQMTYYASAQLLVLSTAGNEDSLDGTAYSQVYLSDDVKVDENGVLTAGYNGRTLYAVDDSGEVIAGPLNYNISDDGNLQVFGNFINEESGAAQGVVHAMFECADAAPGRDLQVLDQYVYDEEANVWSNRLKIEQQDYQRLLLLHDYKSRTYDGDRLLAFSQWKDSGWMGGYEIYLPSSFHFRFFDKNLEGEDLFACFQISDTQANMYGTDLMPVENPDVTGILFEEGAPAGGPAGGTENTGAAEGSAAGGAANETSSAGGTENKEPAAGGEVFTFENDFYRLTLKGEVNHSQNSRNMELEVRLENNSDKTLSLTASNGLLLSDGSRKCICHPSRGGLGFYQLKPGEKETRTVVFSGQSLGKLTKIDRFYLPMQCTLEEVEKEEDSAASGAAGTEETAEAAAGSTSEPAAEESEQKQESELVIDLHPLNLDLSEISAYAGQEDEAVLAETTQDDLHWSLLDINQKQNGDLTPVLLCKNEGTEAKVFATPGSGAVNGFVLSSYIPSYMEKVTLGPGEEICFFMDLYSRQYAWGFFDHLTGSQHLAISDVLRSEGMDSVRSLTLLPARMYSIDDYSDETVDRMPLRFSLNKTVGISRRKADDAGGSPLKNEEGSMEDLPADTEDSGDGQEEASAEGAAELTPEAMTRALDAGGKAPSRKELFSENGVTVYGEHLLIADRRIIGSFLIDNESEEDVKLKFDNWEVNGGQRSSWGDDYISYAGTKMRIFLDHTAREPEEEEGQESDTRDPDLLQEASLTIRKETYVQEQAQDVSAEQGTDQDPVQGTDQNSAGDPGAEQGLPSVYLVTLSFEEGTSFNEDGGRSASFEEIQTSTVCVTEETNKDSIFAEEVSCPENPLQYKRSFSFSLPDTLTEEQRAAIGGVNVWIMRDCTSQMEDADSEGTERCLQSLAAVAMKPAEGKKDTYTADYAGLVCVLGDDHAINISTIEDTSREEETRFAMLGTGSLSSWRLTMNPLISSSSWLGYDFDFRLSIDNQKSTGRVTEFMVDDEDENEKVSKWPLEWFESMEIELGAPIYTRREDGAMEYQSRGIFTGNKSIRLDEGPVKLDMIPTGQFSKDISILYAVWFEDGTSLYYDGGEY